MAINIHQLLINGGINYRKELLTMPVAMLDEVLPFASIRTGIQGKIIGGTLSTNAELRPYKTDKNAQTDATTITPYEWETFLGDVVKEFDPNAILGTLYTELTNKKPTDREITRLVALEMAKKVGESLYNNLFTAVRDASGLTTAALFNGWSTQIAAAVTASTLTSALKNYQDLTATAITSENVGDVLKLAWRALDPQLKKQRVNLMLPVSILEMYDDWYVANHNGIPYNTKFEQNTLEGSNGRCTFAPLYNMDDQDYMIFSTKENMLIGLDQESDKEDVRIRECDNPKAVQFFMMSYFGVGFDNLDKSFINVAKFTTEEGGS